ncbi:MAG: hypothetical protein KME07_09490 [Pegethrix bostrychoides GSE-TBD4-15B]|jgi:hypothetical protein|uniref:Uncharacterized protein n=1 Tax=Pegethrix bostrychoides GSE-TBD4-15B TaxID=2839662 RepID=A0A951U4F0_9CYAN|nr:hypothetical protein [Pegethrix bostrychoides GSE-TBD4-15B]
MPQSASQSALTRPLGFLGSASFSAIVLLAASAQAEPANSTVDIKPAASGYVEFSASEPNQFAQLDQDGQADCSCQNSQLGAGVDAVGDLAIDQYGCDCAGCRNLAMRLLEPGTL